MLSLSLLYLFMCLYFPHNLKVGIMCVPELFLLLSVTLRWPEHNSGIQHTDRRITNSSTTAASLYNHPCYCLCWFIERQWPLVPGSTLPGPTPKLWIVFHFYVTYYHVKTLQPLAAPSMLQMPLHMLLIKWLTSIMHRLCIAEHNQYVCC